MQPDPLQHTVGDRRSRAGFTIAFLDIDQRRKQSVDALMLPKRVDLVQPRRANHFHRGVFAMGDVVQFHRGDREPRIAPRPESLSKVVPPVKRPAVIEQPRHLVLKVADVQQELVFRLVDELRALQHHTRLCQ